MVRLAFATQRFKYNSRPAEQGHLLIQHAWQILIRGLSHDNLILLHVCGYQYLAYRPNQDS